MKATKENPIYSVAVISKSQNTKYNITPAIEDLKLEERDGQIAQSVEITFMNTKVGEVTLNSAIKARDRVYIYADDGSKKEEVFRGFVWTKQYKESTSDKTIQLKCYDHLIYFQESEESKYFSKGQSTKSVIQSICSSWGVKISYSYKSITHGKLVLRGTLSDILTSDILDLVKDRTGTKYVILSKKDVVHVKTVGTNSTIYVIKKGNNAIETKKITTMDGMTTQVKILGKATDSDRKPVEATVKGNTSTYGTLQKLIDRDEDTALANAKKEAQNIIKADGKPKVEYNVVAADIPWIRKGDKVKVQAGGIDKTLIVSSITHNSSLTKKNMDLTLVDD